MVGLFFGTGDRGMIASALHSGLLQDGFSPDALRVKRRG
jgi:hypothetical protein